MYDTRAPQDRSVYLVYSTTDAVFDGLKVFYRLNCSAKLPDNIPLSARQQLLDMCDDIGPRFAKKYDVKFTPRKKPTPP